MERIVPFREKYGPVQYRKRSPHVSIYHALWSVGNCQADFGDRICAAEIQFASGYGGYMLAVLSQRGRMLKGMTMALRPEDWARDHIPQQLKPLISEILDVEQRRHATLLAVKPEDGHAHFARIMAAYELTKVQNPDKNLIELLSHLITHEDDMELRNAMILDLQQYGKAAGSAISMLKNELSTQDFCTRLTIAIALQAVDPGRAMVGCNESLGNVSGLTLRIYHGTPGYLRGKPGKPIPSTPVPNVRIYFLTGNRLFVTTSSHVGKYDIDLPEGTYSIRCEAKDTFENIDNFRAAISPHRKADRQVHVLANENVELNLPVIHIFVD